MTKSNKFADVAHLYNANYLLVVNPKVQFSGPELWRLHLFPHHTCRLNTEPGLAPIVSVMSQIKLVGQTLRIRFSVSTEKI